MRLIVGLGNPGRAYSRTPHNVGFEVLDELTWRSGFRWRSSRKLNAAFAEGEIAGEDCLLLKPTTYMNASGEAVAPLVRGESLETSRDLLVITDDVALSLGRLRLRAKGSSGGHNGLESIRRELKTQDFPRLRCGVAPPEPDEEGGIDAFSRSREMLKHNRSAYVLAKWPADQQEAVEGMARRAADAVEAWLTRNLQEVMSEFNR